MRVAVDLHMHSALSPCSDNEMTPNNIANMSALKGLDIIAVTDHNSLKNYDAIVQCSKGSNIIVVPGMELETREEVHLVCLFPNKNAALKVQEKIHSLLPNIKNREDIFGQQIIFDAEDNITGFYDGLLITAVDISIDEAVSLVQDAGGAVIPAHIDRTSYSIISNLGMVPEHLSFKYLEISKNCNAEELLLKHPELCKYRFIRSSDAHNLGDISEKDSFLELEALSVDALIRELRGF
jgi:3',5'-nucleoside bisphosphate phosphatase